MQTKPRVITVQRKILKTDQGNAAPARSDARLEHVGLQFGQRLEPDI